MDQFYLLEVIVEEINIYDNVPIESIPKKSDQLKVGIIFAHLINTDIQLQDIRGFLVKTERSLKPEVGKSILFFSTPSNLLTALARCPLEVSLKTTVAPYVIGRIDIPWENVFKEIVNLGEVQTNEVLPASISECYETSNYGSKTARLYLTIKLTSYGLEFQTQFQIIPRDNVIGGLSPKKYFFKSINTGVIYKAQVYLEELLCCKDHDKKNSPCKSKNRKDTIKKKIKGENLTDMQLKKILCKHKSCNATKDFARFGIGPDVVAAKVEGLNEVVIPHGMCHVHSELKNYGPNSVYLRPRTVDTPFISKNCERFSSPEYIEALSAYLMRKSENERPCECYPGPTSVCDELLQSYDKLINDYRRMMHLPPLEPTPQIDCDNPDCSAKNNMELSCSICAPCCNSIPCTTLFGQNNKCPFDM